MWPMWAKDGRSIYYVSDRNGTENIWLREPGTNPRAVTSFTNGRLLWPNISYDGRTIVFNRDSQIWKLETENRRASVVNISRRGAAVGPSWNTSGHRSNSEIALAPDGKKTAFIVRGEIYAVSTTDGGAARE